MEQYADSYTSRKESPSTLSRRQSWSRPSPLPHDAIAHESLRDDQPISRRSHEGRGERPFRHEVHSQASDLDSPVYASEEHDDTVHLTSQNTVWRRSTPYERDLERKHGRHSNYNRESRTGALKAMSKSLRRASVRVVNFAGVGLDDKPVRLDDADDPVDARAGAPEVPSVGSLRGNTLGIFGPTNPVRLLMHKLLSSTFTEAIILLLIIINAVVLTIQSVRQIFLQVPDGTGYFHSWEDYALLGLFVIYTFEAGCRIIVSGLLVDPDVTFTSLRISLGGLRRQGSLTTKLSSIRPRFVNNASSPRPPKSPLQASDRNDSTFSDASRPSLKASQFSSTSNPNSRTGSGSKIGLQLRSQDLPFRAALSKQLDITSTSRPYLRHSWNRVDAVAIISFWIMFAICLAGLEKTAKEHLYLFRALSVLRTTRLLAITSGTTTIMTSLKKAAPQLVNVAFFVLFAIILFSIVGVQSFKGSFRRNCVVVNGNIELKSQQCGGHIDSGTLQPVGFIDRFNQSTDGSKGFICPLGQICQESSENPHNNGEQFDNILGAALQIVIIASANGWASNMYSMMAADFFVSSVFFIVCIIVLNFWLLNLFVAVITQSFAATREETKRSAFGAESDGVPLFEDKEDEWSSIKNKRNHENGILQRAYNAVAPFFAVLALASLTLQAIKTRDTPQRITDIAAFCEVGITILFGFEIVWRILAALPDWRSFFSKFHNIADLFLAIICGVIIIPPIPKTDAYSWLTAFQLMRFYRVILLFPGMKTLLFQVFGNMRGLVNMTIFLMLANFLAALFAVQLFRSDVSADVTMNFQGIVTSFLAMYQVFTSENWTDVMWATSDAEFPFRQQVIAILFVVLWFFFANFIMLQMFIAVINENFEVAEEQKRAQQVHAFIRRAEPTTATVSWIDRFNPYRRMKANPRAINVQALPDNLVLPLKKSVVREYRTPGDASNSTATQTLAETAIIRGPLGTMRKLMGMDQNLEHVPLTSLKGTRPKSEHHRDTIDFDETERHLEAINAVNHDTAAEDNRDEYLEQRARKADFINDHPSYDKTLWLFTQSNPIRQLCQKLVPPSNGDNEERINGLPASPWPEFAFRAVMLVTVIAGIIIASIAGPIYRRKYFSDNDFVQPAWFDLAEAIFGFLLVIELVVKVIADGFIFTPNAYLLNIWNILDLVILVAILINVITSLAFVGGLSRGTRALKAFRALRLITLVGWMRETFHSVIFAGARRIIDAAVLAILYMIPYAVWGLNIFSGRMFACNDGNALGKGDCQNEYIASPVDDSLAFLAPRVWDNPSPSTSFSFDSFADSFLILFETVSLEGWIDVLEAALGITGVDQQPRINASQANAVFFVLYNLLGAVVILTLFVSIIISNFSSRSGMALLTAEQRQWIDLKKLISRQKPSKRPYFRPQGRFRSWCFERAVKKRGWWSRTMTLLYCVQIAILMSQSFTDSRIADEIRDLVFLGLAVCFLADPFVKFVGLGWRSFRANGWNIFDVVVILGSIATTLAILMGVGGFAVRQAQKLFLVCVAFKLMQKLDSLNQLFKTAVSSLAVIAKLFGLWFALFLFFGILWLEVFALTKWGSGEDPNRNYQSLSSTLVMLAFMSTGEQWNQFMHDYAISYPRCTNSSPAIVESDCGSVGWSFTLFIAWNVLSMYIFVNMFTGVVVENFSYIYQQRRNQTLNREEMRSFKKVWALFDQYNTGYLERKNIVPFLARLTGVFEVGIYPVDLRYRNVMERSRVTPSEDYNPSNPGKRAGGYNEIDNDNDNDHGNSDHLELRTGGLMDLKKLKAQIGNIDHEMIRGRRKIYNRIFWEAQLAAAQGDGRGISFQSMLILLSHHKLIDDEKALRVDEIIRRRAITEQVRDRVNFDKVRSLFRMIYHRKRFVAHWEAKQRQMRMNRGDVPEIVVADAEFLSPPMRSQDIARARASHDSFGTIDLDSPSPAQMSFGGGYTNNPLFHNANNSRFDLSPTTPLSPHGLWSDPASPTAPSNFLNSNANAHSYSHSASHSHSNSGSNANANVNVNAGPGSAGSGNTRNPYRQSDQSIMSQSSGRMNSPGSPSRNPKTMSVEDPSAILHQLNASVWGDMMMEEEEEEEEADKR